MADQAPAERDTPQDAPTVDTPTQDRADTEEQVNWQERAEQYQKRYDDVVPEFTRKSQRLSEVEQENDLYRQFNDPSNDIQARREAAEALGIADQYDWGEEPQSEPFVDEQARRDAALAKQRWEQFDQQAQQYSAEQAEIDHVNAELPAVEKQLGRELTQQEAQVIGDLSRRYLDESGVPQVGMAAELVLGVLKDATQNRPRPRAPHFSANGAEGTTVPDLSTHEGKVDHIMSRLHA